MSVLMTYTVGYIGLPDMMYRDVIVEARNAQEAEAIADKQLLAEYGTDGHDCLGAFPLTPNVEFYTDTN